MKNFIISTKASISRIANYFRTLREHPVLSVVLAGVIFLLSSLGQTAIGKVTQMVFPQLDDAGQIITNQNKQFAEVKENLDRLASKLSGADRAQLDSLRDAIKVASSGSENVATRLSQLTEENRNLRSVLKKEKGIAGGVDLLIPERDGYKIDSSTTLGFNSFNGAGAALSLSSLNTAESVLNRYTPIGQGISFTNDAGKSCLVTFLGASKIDGGSLPLGKFALQCKTSV
jgi:hypothetical protein